MVSIAAAILAGGGGTRMGGADKALVEVGGQRLIDRVAAAIGPVDRLLVMTGPQARMIAGISAEPVADLQTEYGGPLAGVAAAIERIGADRTELLLTVAVDTPFFPPDFLARARTLINEADVVVAAWAGQDYPTNALWRVAGIAGLPAAVRQGTAPHSLKRLVEGLRARRLDYSGLAAEDPFLNANTPAELALLEARALRHRSS